MYVERVILKDFRCFERAEVSLAYPLPKRSNNDTINNVTLLIGINGAGKTTVLKSIALGVLAPIYEQLGYRPYLLIRKKSNKLDKSDRIATIEMYYRRPFDELNQKGNNFSGSLFSGLNQLIIGRKGHEDVIAGALYSNDKKFWQEILNAESHPAFFMLGYGATRRAEYIENISPQNLRRYHHRFQRVAGLFEEFIALYPLAAWYSSLKSKTRSQEILALLNELLPVRTQFTGECKNGEGLFESEGVTLPFSALSDGYRSFIGLMADMLYHMHSVWPKGKLTELNGVVMIDDIDVHLHPGWQREVVPKLAKTFPKLQFIITTHSPLVVGTVHAANIRVVEDNQIREFTEETDGKTADQILMSSYFGLSSPRSPAKVKKLKRIANRIADTHDTKEAVAFLKELSGNKNGSM